MPVEQKFWKTTFYRNNDDKGGAMLAAISSAKPEHIILHSHTRKNGRIWGSTTPEALLKLLETNKGIYEVIHKFPHKVYFDIDKQVCEEESIHHEDFINEVREIILEVFTNAIMNISGSITDKKISYHICLENYMIHNEDERQKMKFIVKTMNKKCSAFDWKVYTKNRNMKCIYQSKEDGRVQEILYDSSKDYKKHLITCFFPTYPLQFPTLSEQMILEVEIEKSKGSFDLSLLPKLSLPAPENFDFFDESITPLEILKLLPLNEKDFDHSYTFLVARFCFHNQLSFETFISWYSKKSSTPANIQKWKHHWTNLSKFAPVSSSRIKQILEYFYPHIKKDIHYRRFTDSFFLSRVSTTKIECITDKCFETPEKFIIFNVGMGGGKTYKTIEALHKYSSIIWIAPTRSLANNTLKRLNDANLNFIDYQVIPPKLKQKGELDKYERLIIVQNSLHYVNLKNYDCVVIDEIESVLNTWYGNFMKENKLPSWKNFLRIIESAKKVILLDAFTTKKTIDFCVDFNNNFSNKVRVFERINEPMTRTITFCENFEEQIMNMVTDLKNGLKLFVFYPFKKESRDYHSMEKFFYMLTKAANVEGVYYNADVDDKIKDGIKDVNTSWKNCKLVVANSSITCGVNYEIMDFDKEYIFIANYNSPRDIIQFTYRPRYLRTNIINICYLGKMISPDSWLDDRKTDMKNCQVYNKLFENIMIEKKVPIKKGIQLFANKAHYYQKTEKKHVVSDTITREFEELSNKYDIGFNYNNIPLIDETHAQAIQQDCIALQATMWEKVALQKYFFNLKFKESAKNVTDFFGDTEINVLETSWNENLSFFFDRLLIILQDPKHLFNKIKEENGWKTIFPECELSQVKLSLETKKIILDNFYFRRPSMEMKKCNLIKSAYNTFFNKFIITSSCDESRNVSFNCNTEWYNIFYRFAKEYMNDADLVIDYEQPNTFEDAPDLSTWFKNEKVKDVVIPSVDL